MGDLKSRSDRTVERKNGGMTHMNDGMMERRKTTQILKKGMAGRRTVENSPKF